MRLIKIGGRIENAVMNTMLFLIGAMLLVPLIIFTIGFIEPLNDKIWYLGYIIIFWAGVGEFIHLLGTYKESE